jgi:hypothetical protein
VASEGCLLKMAKGFGTRERIYSVFRKTKFAKTEPLGISSHLQEVYDSGLTQLSREGNHSRGIPCLPAIIRFPTYLLPHAGSAIALPLTECWHQKIKFLSAWENFTLYPTVKATLFRDWKGQFLSETQKSNPVGKTLVQSEFEGLRSRCAAAARRIARFRPLYISLETASKRAFF